MEEHADIIAGGNSRKASSRSQISVINPATEEVIGKIPDCDETDVATALAAAHSALQGSEWSMLSPHDRASLLRALANVIERDRERFALLVTSQNGVAIGSSRASIEKAVQSYRYYADVADALEIEEIRRSDGNHTIVRREPIGVAGLIVPWNGPQPLLSWKLAPALVAGCTVVIKPAPETTLDAYLLLQASIEAGFPPGVINLLPGGRETGAALVRNTSTNKVAFTGSTEAGRKISEVCGYQLKPATLELGGKSAAIVLEDVEMSTFAPFVATVCSPNTGQVCRACTRILVPKSSYEEAVEVVVSAMREIVVGDPLDAKTQFGPLVSARQRERVEAYIATGKREGAKLVTGGGRPKKLPIGYYVEPTVFSDVSNDMTIAQEEIFGPVLVVIPYESIADAISLANDSNYGLGGFVYTGDLERGTEVARRLETGSVGVNYHAMAIESPFGGYKQSGLGREMGPEAVENYTQMKSIYRAGPPPS
jgi:acyl-CoA reductase-like NAD-dependent aldehyde dehydrogenase